MHKLVCLSFKSNIPEAMKTNFYNCKAERMDFSPGVLMKASRLFAIAFLLLINYYPVFSQTSSFSFTQIPISSTDLLAPGRGSEHWGSTDWDGIYAPLVPLGNSKPLNYYDRF